MNPQQKQFLFEALGIGVKGASRLLDRAAGHGVESDDPILASNFISAVEKMNENLEKLNKSIEKLKISVEENTEMMDRLGEFIDDLLPEQ